MTTQIKTPVTKKKDKAFNWIAVFSMIILIYTFYDQCSNRSSKADNMAIVMALQDTLQTWKTEDSLNKAKITVLETENTDSFLLIKSKDSTIIRLQKIVAAKKKDMTPGSSATTGTTETEGSGTSTNSEVRIVYKDTFYYNEFDFGGWVMGSSLAGKDSTSYTFKIKNEFDLLIGEEKTGWLGLGRPKPYVEMTNYNPYTTTTELRTYKVSVPKPYNLVVGPSLGYGWGGWMFGVSATYPLFKFSL